MKKKYTTLFGIAIISTICIFINYQFYVIPQMILGMASVSTYSPLKEEIDLLEEIYSLDFKLSANTSESKNIYIPRNNITEERDAVYYFDLFKTDSEILNTEDYFYGKSDIGETYVYKYDNMLKFIPTETINQDKIEISSDYALKKAISFINNNYLALTYEEALVNYSKEKYTVKFISRLGNLKNYAFNTLVIIDKFGNITKLEYHYKNYDKIDSVKIKSMEDAFYELPIDFPEYTNPKIKLENCKLVYIYENSILQPAYLFEGETNDGKNFSSYVNGTLF